MGTPASGRINRAAVEILAISFVILFQELTLIRWLPGQVRVLAYFPNLILISAFLGLGLGCLRADKRSLLWLWPISLMVIVAVTWGLGHIAFTQSSVSEHLWLLYHDLPAGAPVIESIQPPIVLQFILSAVTFVPLGQLLAQRLETFRELSSPLWGYSWDLLGSILGVVTFAAFGMLGVFPWQWFVLIFVVGLVLFRPRRLALGLTLAAAILIPLGVFQTERAQHYSPYYALATAPSEGLPGFSVLANGSLHQTAAALGSGGEPLTPAHGPFRDGYHAPYRLLREIPEKVLVLGAGTGNDVAVLLDEGVARIDAVEIDPVIIELGANHPDRPYDSDRVRVINTDARSFLNQTEERYDLVVFGTVDSMTRLSALSNVRLDNFVYTLDAIEAARRLLEDDGGMVMYFMVSTGYIHQRLIGILARAFGEAPLVREKYAYLFNRIYMAGPAFAHLQDPDTDHAAIIDNLLSRIDLPTDDWPYLYLASRSISPFYLTLIAAFAAIAVVGVFLSSRDMRESLGRKGGVDVEMFLYGAGFLLMEASFVTAMNLIWGATWLTSAVVFGSVLTMILVATIGIELKSMPWRVAAGGLVVSLLVTWGVPLQWLLVDDTMLKLALSVFYVGLPIYFAAACFAIRFRARPSPGVAIGWNLLGAVTGGLLEFLSMITGLRALILVAVVLYAGAIYWRRHAPEPPAEA